MGDWLVAVILLGLSALVVGTLVLICRFLGYFRFASPFETNEESANLTASHGGLNGYSKNQPPTDLHVHYDSLRSSSMSSSKYADVEADIGHPVLENGRESPVSPDNVSIASEHEIGVGLQRAMSCDSVASDSSVVDLETNQPKIGQIEFGLEYDREVSELVISVIQARALEANKVTGTLDSYVKVWVTPHTSGRFQTRVQKETVNPNFTERFLCNVEPDVLENTTVQFQVFSSDQFARHKLQGETDVRLGDLNLRQPLRIWMNLRDLDQRPTELGDIFFSVSYLPTAERLTVVVAKARNLKWSYGKEVGDCFVKVYLLQNGKKISKKKTTLKREEKNPIFNEAVIFNVPANALKNVQLRLTMAEHYNDGTLTSIGHVILGSNVSGTELTHWNQMMTSLRRPIAMWHRLRR